MPILFVRKAKSDEPILRAADAMAPKLKKAFLDAVALMKNTVAIDKLAKAIQEGDADAALAVLATDQGFTKALHGQGLEPSITSFREAVQQTFAAGAKVAIGTLPKKVGIQLSFNLMSPEAVNHLETYSFNLIQQVAADTREAVRNTVLRAFKEGGHPYEQAREIRNAIGLTAKQEAAVANFKNALSDPSSMRDALARSLRDGRYDRTLLKAIKSGKGLTQNQIDTMVDRYRQRYIQYRAQTIARTESIRASNQGQREVWRQAQRQGLMGDKTIRRWITSGDDRTCSVCEALDGETAGIDEEFDDGIMEPPDPHPDCRCTLALEVV